MKNIFWLLAGAVLALTGCGDGEQAVTQGQVDRAVQEETAEMAGDVAVGIPSETVAGTGSSGMTSVETTGSAAAGNVESAGDVIESVGVEAGDSLAAAAGAAGGEAPAQITESVEAGTAGATGVAGDAMADYDLALGEKIYGSHCVACHGTGATGAPKLGDAANWTPRIAQGMEVMVANAVNGFRGAAGYMPPKGGFGGLTDEEVTAAVAYMAADMR